MKNAYVLSHHRGDDGTVSEGMILMDVTEKRFGELEAKSLVREATAAEVKAGYRPPFLSEAEAAQASKAAPAPANKKAAEPANKSA